MVYEGCPKRSSIANEVVYILPVYPEHSPQPLGRRTLGLRTSLGLNISSRLLLASDLLHAHLLSLAAMSLRTVSSKHLQDRQWYAQVYLAAQRVSMHFALMTVHSAAHSRATLCWWMSAAAEVVLVAAEARNKT